VLLDERPADPAGAPVPGAARARRRVGQVGATAVAPPGGDKHDQVQGDEALCDVVQRGDNQVADYDVPGDVARVDRLQGRCRVEHQFVAPPRGLSPST